MENTVLLFLLFIESAISLEKEPPLPKPIDLIRKQLKDDIESRFGPLDSYDDSNGFGRTNIPKEVVKQNTPVMTTLRKKKYNTTSDKLTVKNNRTGRKRQKKSNRFDNTSNGPQNSSIFTDSARNSTRTQVTEQGKSNIKLGSKEDFIDKLILDIDDTRKSFKKSTTKKSSEFKDKETQLEWAHCQDIITPFIKGLKQNISNPKHVDSKGYEIRRFIHLIKLNTEEYADQVQSILLQISNLQLRVFQWTSEAISAVLDALAFNKVHDFKHLKLGVQRLFSMWNLNINNTVNLLKQARIFRPPCIRKPVTLSTKSHKGHNYKNFKPTLSPKPSVNMPKPVCRGRECSTPSEDTVYFYDDDTRRRLPAKA